MFNPQQPPPVPMPAPPPPVYTIVSVSPTSFPVAPGSNARGLYQAPMVVQVSPSTGIPPDWIRWYEAVGGRAEFVPVTSAVQTSPGIWELTTPVWLAANFPAGPADITACLGWGAPTSMSAPVTVQCP